MDVGGGVNPVGARGKSGALAVASLAVLAGVVVVFSHVRADGTNPFMDALSCFATPNPIAQGGTTAIEGTADAINPMDIDAGQYSIDLLPDPGSNTHVDWWPTAVNMTGPWGPVPITFGGLNNTAFLSVGAHTVYIHALGSNGQWTHPCSFTLTVDPPGTDTFPPLLGNVTWTPDNVIGPAETTVGLSFTLDDSTDGGAATIAGAPNQPRYWVSGCAVLLPPDGTFVSVDGAYDEPVEDATTVIDTTGWLDGNYLIDLSGQDSLGNLNTTCVQTTLVVNRAGIDLTAPTAGSGAVAPPGVSVGGGPVTLTATIDESATGGTLPVAAEYFVDPVPSGGSNPPPYVAGSGVPMAAQDGTFDSATEPVTATVDVSTWVAGTFTFYLHGRDGAGNYGSWSAAPEFTTAVLTITAGPPVPGSPTAVTLTVSGPDLVLTWSPPSGPGLDHYNLYEMAAPTSGGCPTGAPLAPLPAPASSSTRAGRAADAARYFYVVRAANALDQEDGGCQMVGKIAVDLPQGVSQISTPFLPTSVATTDIFFPVWSVFLGVGAYAPATGWRFYNQSGGGSLAVLDNGMGLRVVLSAPARLPLVGWVPVNAPDRAVAFAAPGRYFIGVASFTLGGLMTPGTFDNDGLSGAWARALAYSTSPYDHWRQWSVGDTAFRDLTTINAGGGYWIEITSPATWTPPVV